MACARGSSSVSHCAAGCSSAARASKHACGVSLSSAQRTRHTPDKPSPCFVASPPRAASPLVVEKPREAEAAIRMDRREGAYLLLADIEEAEKAIRHTLDSLDGRALGKK